MDSVPSLCAKPTWQEMRLPATMPMRRTPGTWTKVFYGLGSVAFGIKDNGFAFFLLLYYNQVLGLPEAWVGFGIMLALIMDAIFDPVVGYVSDHLHSRWGRRHPFMYAAALPVGLSYYLLWNPPALPPAQLFAYFAVLAVLVRVLIACYEIPSSSLVAELTDHYDERTAILSYRYFFGWWGGLTVAVLAYSLFLTPDAAHPVGVLNPTGYQRYGLVAALLMAAAILTSAVGTHSFIPYLRRPPSLHRPGMRAALAELSQTLANRAFLWLFGAGIFGGMAAGITAALTIYFNTYFWELSSQEMSLLAMLNFVSAAVAFAVAPRLSVRFGKKAAALGSSLIVLVFGPTPIFLRLLGLFPDNGSPALLPTLAVMNTTLVTLFITASILITSMLADVVEDSEVSTGRRSEGVFFAANAFVQKSVSGVGIFASTLLLNAIGFPRGATPGTVDAEVVRSLGLIYAPAFVVLYLITLTCVSAYNISRTSHEANLARLGR
jgi:GPH family glycoside/pentoside/hexuronide:cation symporter